MPARSELNRLSRRIADLEARPKQPWSDLSNPEWMDPEAAITAVAILKDLESRLAAAFGLPEQWVHDATLPRGRVHSAAIVVLKLFMTWKAADSAEAAFAASERIVTNWPAVEGSRELTARLWPHLDPDAPFIDPMHRVQSA